MRKAGLSEVQASFLHRLESAYNRLVWTPSQVHEKIASVLNLLNSKMPKGSFCQATVELNDDVPVVRVLLGPNERSLHCGENRLLRFLFHRSRD
jgi:hypothetical protein